MAINKEILDEFLKEREFWYVFQGAKETLETACEYLLPKCKEIATKNNIQIPIVNISQKLCIINQTKLSEIVKRGKYESK